MAKPIEATPALNKKQTIEFLKKLEESDRKMNKIEKKWVKIIKKFRKYDD